MGLPLDDKFNREEYYGQKLKGGIEFMPNFKFRAPEHLTPPRPMTRADKIFLTLMLIVLSYFGFGLFFN
jgi:hypothetical protein